MFKCRDANGKVIFSDAPCLASAAKAPVGTNKAASASGKTRLVEQQAIYGDPRAARSRGSSRSNAGNGGYWICD